MNAKKLSLLINAASGKCEAELVIKNCRVVNPITRTVKNADIAVEQGLIAGVGSYHGKTEIDAHGLFAVAGLIDAHVHIESSMCTPESFAQLVVPKGTTTVIADPHEIANVSGSEGIHFMINSARRVPLKVHFMIPSCVPATGFEDSGAALDSEAVEELLKKPEILGLGELMNAPGVSSCDSEVLEKICAAKNAQKIIDGHAPGLNGFSLNAYSAAGIKTDHECSSPQEVLERLENGMYVLLRQGSAAQNLAEILPSVTRENSRRCAMCTDDKHPQDIIEFGHINANLKLAVKNGLDCFTAIAMATVNAAECYGLNDVGLIAPGYSADIVLFNNLEDFEAEKVFIDGKLAAENGKAVFEIRNRVDKAVTHSVHIKPFIIEDLEIKLNSENAKVISLKNHELVTKCEIRKVNLTNGIFDCKKNPQIQKLIVMERHKKSGKIGKGLIENYGIHGGAIATTIAHDSHNIIAAGDNDSDIFIAVNELNKMGGGIILVKRGTVIGSLSLPIAGLMSDKNFAEVSKTLKNLLELAWNELGISREIEPFMTLSFLSLPVIPEIKLTPRGLFDVNEFKFTPIEAD
ncbi:adenine deaminase [uncultured Treponema sp.]|uniref:adenine deaminase n=1 Tax=uncultured Treponema sp. TaxID=162155 RepID=UPI0025F75B7B|nr:adenine deaminase [uncultured Treponema sp.]